MALLIAEELLLVSRRAEGTGGRVNTEMQAALGGALMVELALNGNIELDGKQVAALGTSTPPREPILGDALAAIAAKPRKADKVVRLLARNAPERTRARLTERGVLTRKRGRRLGLVPADKYTLADAAAIEEPLSRLRAAVVDRAEPDERTAALAGLVHAAKLGRRVFPRDDRRAVKRRLAEIADGDWSAAAVRRAVAAATAATAAVAAAGASAASS
jgi:hypothetical protein